MRAPAAGGRSSGRAAVEIADGVYVLALGAGPAASNVYLVRSDPSWVLMDTGWPGHAAAIVAAAESVFGRGARPTAVLLTHLHRDHSGCAAELARRWDVPVYVHSDELAATGAEYVLRYGNPLDRWLIEPMIRLLPAGRRARVMAGVPAGDLAGVVRYLDPGGAVPGLPGWRAIPVPGHTPGHVAFHRPADAVVLTGDALLTVDLNSIRGIVSGRRKLARPPRYTTWNWPAAVASIAAIAELDPAVVGPGHGRPLDVDAGALRQFASRIGARRHRLVPAGFFRPVDYSARTRYRTPPPLYSRVQRWLGPALLARGLGPGYAVVLEVPGRRTGRIRRTSLVQVDHAAGHYLVSLAGESEWVRNVRAAGGRAVLGRRHRRAVTLVEVPAAERAPVIQAYLRRPGPGGRTVDRSAEARLFFGVGPGASTVEIERVTGYYPVFRIAEWVARDNRGPSRVVRPVTS